MNIKFVHLPQFDDPLVQCVLCETSSPGYEAKLLGGRLCQACVDEALDMFNGISRIRITNAAIRKDLNRHGRQMEFKLLFDKDKEK